MLDTESSQAEPREGIKRTPRNAVKPQSEAKRKAKETRENQMASVGKLLPSCPMTPDELAEAWSVASDDAETIMVKVQRYQIGTRDLELVDSIPLIDFDGEALAGRYGPGNYFLRPAAGPYAKHSAKLPISDALARKCGYGRIMPTATELVAERTIRDAANGPTDPLSLVAAIEAVMDRRDRERGTALNPGQPYVPAAHVDPLANMQNQFNQIQSMMTFMASLEERAIKTVEMRMGRQDFNPSAEDTNTSLLEKLLPKALDIFGSMMQNRNAAPAPVPVHQVQPNNPPTIAAVQPTPPQEATNMPTLTPEEHKAIAGAVAMLRPFASNLVEMAASSADDAAIVAELEAFIPGAMIGPLASLSAVVATHGPAVLGAIHPALASERWAGILPKLVAACEAE